MPTPTSTPSTAQGAALGAPRSKPQGSNKQPSQHLYIASGRNASRTMKRAVEQFKTYRRATRLTAAERSALAYFTQPMGRNE